MTLQDSPFPLPSSLERFTSEVYATQQTAVQRSVYSLSGSVFSYSPESFALDAAIKTWSKHQQPNVHGVIPPVNELQTRSGAGAALLGYAAHAPVTGSQSLPAPQSIIASSATLTAMNPVLSQYIARGPSASNPWAIHLAALDYDDKKGTLYADYSNALQTARDLGLGLIASHNAIEAQHISLLSTALSSVLPSIHIYDGIRATREFNKVSEWLTSKEIADTYSLLTSAYDLGENSLVGTISSLFETLNRKLSTSYKPFEYVGSSSPSTVLVTFGSSESILASQVANSLSQSGEAVGAIAVRLYSPFLDAEFFKVLPSSTKRIIVLGQVSDATAVQDSTVHSQLFRDVSSVVGMKFGFAIASPVVYDHKYEKTSVLSQSDIYSLFEASVPASRADVKKVTFWDADNSKVIDAPARLTHTISLDGISTVSSSSKYDNEAQGGVIETEVRVASSVAAATAAPFVVDNDDLVFVGSPDITKSFNVLKNAKQGAKVVVVGKVNAEELGKVLSPEFKKAAIAKEITLYAVDIEAIGDESETQGRTRNMVFQTAFWKTFAPELTLNQITTKIVTACGVDTELVAATVARLSEKVMETFLGIVELPKEWAEIEATEVLPGSIELISFSPNENRITEDEEEASSNAVTASDSWHSAAKKFAFSEAYGTTNELRPDLPVKNFVARVKENRRVTPEDYERHIFHFELDITGTGLKYAIGEALGVHARNEEKSVRAFLNWYGVSASSTVTIASREAPESLVETRTALQAFRDNLDLFGKPPKKFYESLAPFAKDNEQRAHLEKLASPAGAEELKKRAEVDFETYVDVLEEFTSAKPSLPELVQMIAPLKRREYSIASSQHAHPNEVHLLIVVVDWVDSKGRKRYGQCSRYLSKLPVGAELVVSVKPSVMKLPPSPKQPIVMSGLGTGLAPFKALIEEKVWQKEQGMDIGEIFLYLGSRHQREEYLYGEIWEAYRDAGIITHIGAAFSRDQPHKIYIQDKIRESIDDLVDAVVEKQGYFYLCGPTWPVPDITACLEDILKAGAKKTGKKIDTAREIEEMKETGKYVLEVY